MNIRAASNPYPSEPTLVDDFLLLPARTRTTYNTVGWPTTRLTLCPKTEGVWAAADRDQRIYGALRDSGIPGKTRWSFQALRRGTRNELRNLCICGPSARKTLENVQPSYWVGALGED